MKKITELVYSQRFELTASFLVILTVFSIFFYNVFQRAFFMALAAFVVIEIPGVLLARLFFRGAYANWQLYVIGFGLGMIYTPLLIYLITIFEVASASALAYSIPILSIPVLAWLNYVSESDI